MNKLILILSVAFALFSCEKEGDKEELYTNPNPVDTTTQIRWIESNKQAIIQSSDWEKNGDSYFYSVDIPVATNQSNQQVLPDSIGTAYGKTYQDFRFEFPHDLHNRYQVSYTVTESSWIVKFKPNVSGVDLDEKYSLVKFTGVVYYKY